MKDKNIIDVLAISGLILPFIVFFFDLKCIFKRIFNIPCISCGLTRAFISIIHLDFISALKYNVLSIPLFIFIIIFYILYFLNKIFNKDYIYHFYSIISNNYKVLLLLLIVTWFINLITYLM